MPSSASTWHPAVSAGAGVLAATSPARPRATSATSTSPRATTCCAPWIVRTGNLRWTAELPAAPGRRARRCSPGSSSSRFRAPSHLRPEHGQGRGPCRCRRRDGRSAASPHGRPTHSARLVAVTLDGRMQGFGVALRRAARTIAGCCQDRRYRPISPRARYDLRASGPPSRRRMGCGRQRPGISQARLAMQAQIRCGAGEADVLEDQPPHQPGDRPAAAAPPGRRTARTRSAPTPRSPAPTPRS